MRAVLPPAGKHRLGSAGTAGGQFGSEADPSAVGVRPAGRRHSPRAADPGANADDRGPRLARAWSALRRVLAVETGPVDLTDAMAVSSPGKVATPPD